MNATETYREVSSRAFGTANGLVRIATTRRPQTAIIFQETEPRQSLVDFRAAIQSTTAELELIAGLDLTKLFDLMVDGEPLPEGQVEIADEEARAMINAVRGSLLVIHGPTAHLVLGTARQVTPDLAEKLDLANRGACKVLHEILRFMSTVVDDPENPDAGFDLIGEAPDVGPKPSVGIDDLH